MALSGSIAGYTSNANITARIDWSAEQSVSGNYSIITAKLYYMKPAGFANTYGTMNCTIHIGSYSKSFSGRVTIPGGGEVCVDSFTQKVYHADNGNLTVPISATGAIPDTSLEWTSLEDDVQLDSIPRASIIIATDANIGAASMIAVSVKGSSFTHSIHFQFGEHDGFIDEDGNVGDTEVKHTSTYIPFIIPEYFYGVIPNSKSGKCTLTCTTYSDGTVIGTSTYTFTVYTSEEECKPAVSGTVVDFNEDTIALTGDENVLVRYMSMARCTITAEAKHGADISTTMINNVDVEDSVDIMGVETGKFVFYANDSRGYSASVTVEKTLIPYIMLTCSKALVQRTDPTSGKAVLTVKGNYFNGSFGAEDNALTVEYSIDGGDPVEVNATVQGNSYTASAELSGLDYQTSHNILVEVRDKIGYASKPCTVNKGLPVFDWGENDFRFNVPVYDRYNKEFVTEEDLAERALAEDLDELVESLQYYVLYDDLASYVVDEYTSGNWKVREWSNGECELWGTFTGTGSAVAWGALYAVPDVIPQQTYPVTFANAPYVQYSSHWVSGNTHWLYASDKVGTTTKTPSLSAAEVSKQNVTAKVTFYVKGILA